MTDTRFLFLVAEAPDATVIDSQVVDAIGRGRPRGRALRPALLRRTAPLRREASLLRACAAREIAARTGWQRCSVAADAAQALR